jgi:hypothetical protein
MGLAPYVLLTSIVSTVITGVWYDQSAPYFPIEISRTANGPNSGWVFSIGITLSVITLLFEHPLSLGIGILIVGILLLAWIDDETSHFWHMFGVLLLPIGAFFVVDWKRAWVPLLCATLMWIGRLFIKSMAVVFLENIAIRDAAVEGIAIMYHGDAKDPFTLVLFKVTGVLQWIVLWILFKIVFKN